MHRHLTEGSSGSSQQLRIGAAIQLHSAVITKVQPWCDGHHKKTLLLKQESEAVILRRRSLGYYFQHPKRSDVIKVLFAVVTCRLIVAGD
jgi:hypothetical protein